MTYPVSCSNSPGDFGGPLAFCHGEFEQEGVWRKEEVGGPRLRSIFVLKKRFENFISHYQAHQKLSNEKLFTDFHDEEKLHNKLFPILVRAQMISEFKNLNCIKSGSS